MVQLASALGLIPLLHGHEESVAGLLGVTQQHGCVGLEEDRVVHGSVADSEGTLHHDGLFDGGEKRFKYLKH